MDILWTTFGVIILKKYVKVVAEMPQPKGSNPKDVFSLKLTQNEDLFTEWSLNSSNFKDME